MSFILGKQTKLTGFHNPGLLWDWLNPPLATYGLTSSPCLINYHFLNEQRNKFTLMIMAKIESMISLGNWLETNIIHSLCVRPLLLRAVSFQTHPESKAKGASLNLKLLDTIILMLWHKWTGRRKIKNNTFHSAFYSTSLAGDSDWTHGFLVCWSKDLSLNGWLFWAAWCFLLPNMLNIMHDGFVN